MPVENCQINGKPGFKWGNEGKCYTYNVNDERSIREARQKAIDQGRAIKPDKKDED